MATGGVYVYYYLPYDGDVEEHPNAFCVQKSGAGGKPAALTLGDIKQAFPLPGTYFFRAKSAYAKTHVWLDLNADDEVVVPFNGKIMLKVSRLAHAAPAATRTSAPATAAAATVTSPAPAATPAQRPVAPTAAASAAGTVPKAAAASASPASTGGVRPAGGAAPAAAAHTAAHASTADMLGLFDAPSPASDISASSAARPASGTAASAGNANSHLPADIFAFHSPPAAAPVPAPMGAPQAGFRYDAFAHAGLSGSSPSPVPGMQAAAGGGMRPGGGRMSATPVPSPAAAKPTGNILSGDIFNM